MTLPKVISPHGSKQRCEIPKPRPQLMIGRQPYPPPRAFDRQRRGRVVARCTSARLLYECGGVATAQIDARSSVTSSCAVLASSPDICGVVTRTRDHAVAGIGGWERCSASGRCASGIKHRSGSGICKDGICIHFWLPTFDVPRCARRKAIAETAHRSVQAERASRHVRMGSRTAGTPSGVLPAGMQRVRVYGMKGGSFVVSCVQRRLDGAIPRRRA